MKVVIDMTAVEPDPGHAISIIWQVDHVAEALRELGHEVQVLRGMPRAQDLESDVMLAANVVSSECDAFQVFGYPGDVKALIDDIWTDSGEASGPECLGQSPLRAVERMLELAWHCCDDERLDYDNSTKPLSAKKARESFLLPGFSPPFAADAIKHLQALRQRAAREISEHAEKPAMSLTLQEHDRDDKTLWSRIQHRAGLMRPRVRPATGLRRIINVVLRRLPPSLSEWSWSLIDTLESGSRWTGSYLRASVHVLLNTGTTEDDVSGVSGSHAVQFWKFQQAQAEEDIRAWQAMMKSETSDGSRMG